MIILKTFLRALENRMDNKRGFYVPNLTIIPTKFGAIKDYKITVYMIDGDYKQLISEVNQTANICDIREEDLLIELQRKSIENILNWYGI